MKVTPVDISDLFAVEVDFAEDLVRAIEARQAHARGTSG
jgi:choline kinase